MTTEANVPSWVEIEPKEAANPEMPVNSLDDGICKMCKKKPYNPEFPLSYCDECRERLIRRPIPTFIKVLGAAVGIMMVIAAMKVPNAYSNSKAYKEGVRYYQAEAYASAVKSFEYLTKNYPDRPEFNTWMFLSYAQAGQADQAEIALEKVSGTMEDLSFDLTKAIEAYNEERGAE